VVRLLFCAIVGGIVALWLCASSARAQFDDPAKPPVGGVPKTKGKTKATPKEPKKDPKEVKNKEPEPLEKLMERGVQLDTAEKQLWRCGVQVRAQGSPVGNIFGTIAVPTDWPEQTVRIHKEDFTPNVKKTAYRIIDQGVRQMTIAIPTLAASEQARSQVVFEVERYSLKPPPDTTIFVLPTKVPTLVKKHLGISPQIESTQLKFKKLGEELTADKSSAWQQVEAIYDGVREKVKFENDKDKGALAALNDGLGNKHDVTGVFVATCRAMKIPARIVWIPDNLYAEFYLEDEEGNGYWIPCFVAQEKREFGGVSTHAPILQKGDNFKVPEKKEVLRFVNEFLTAKGTVQPQVEFVRRLEGIVK
jgi:transglutaminase-like putative cysteine protease